MSTPIHVLITDQNGSIELVDRAPQQLGANDIRISVRAAGINPIDDYVINGFARNAGWSAGGPLGLGWDVAGTISEIGTDVSDPALSVGTQVAALSDGAVKEVGGQAEDVVLPASAVAAIPEGLDLVDAGSLPLITLTADQALDLLGTPSGTLLVTGIGGGVGGYAGPLAKARGWRVVGLGRDTDRDHAESAGIDFITELPTDGTTFDAVVDSANLGTAATAAIRPGGALVELVQGNTPPADGVTVHSVMVTSNGARLAELLAAAVLSDLPIRVRATFPITQADKAYAAFRDGGRGRIVLVTHRR